MYNFFSLSTGLEMRVLKIGQKYTKDHVEEGSFYISSINEHLSQPNMYITLI